VSARSSASVCGREYSASTTSILGGSGRLNVSSRSKSSAIRPNPAEWPSSTLSIPRPQTDAELSRSPSTTSACASKQACCQGTWHRPAPSAMRSSRVAKSPSGKPREDWAGSPTCWLRSRGWRASPCKRASPFSVAQVNSPARVQRYARIFWMKPHAPVALLKGDPSKREFELEGGVTVEAQLASQRSVRGAHPSAVAHRRSRRSPNGTFSKQPVDSRWPRQRLRANGLQFNPSEC